MYVVVDAAGRYLARGRTAFEWVSELGQALSYGDREADNAAFMARCYGGQVREVDTWEFEHERLQPYRATKGTS